MPAQKKKQQTKMRQAGKKVMRKRRARRLQMKNPMTQRQIRRLQTRKSQAVKRKTLIPP